MLASLALLPGAARAEMPEDWLERPRLSGAWGDVRSRLAERGIELHASYTTGFWSNLDGGIETGTRYEGFADWGADVDLDRAAGWRGGSFHINWISYHGGRPSEDLIGQFSAQNVSGWEAEDSVRFYDIYLQQDLFDGKLLLKAGQMAVDDHFFVSRYAAPFLNAAFGDFTSNATALSAPVYPLTAPGLYLFLVPRSHVSRASASTPRMPGRTRAATSASTGASTRTRVRRSSPRPARSAAPSVCRAATPWAPSATRGSTSTSSAAESPTGCTPCTQ